MIYGGCLKNGHIKVGRTRENAVVDLRTRYQTYYGDFEGWMVKSDDTEIHETQLKNCLARIKYSGEIFECRVAKMKNYLKCITGANKCTRI